MKTFFLGCAAGALLSTVIFAPLAPVEAQAPRPSLAGLQAQIDAIISGAQPVGLSLDSDRLDGLDSTEFERAAQ